MEIASLALVALYLRGAPRTFELRRGNWRDVVRVLRVSGETVGGASHALREAGLWAEALALDNADLLRWAERIRSTGKAIAAEDTAYPWPENGPPALWIEGEMPCGPFLTIVGSRNVEREHRAFARGCGTQSAALGYSVASGGAIGCDREAVRGALSAGGNAVELLPCGLSRGHGTPSACRLTVCAPDEPFSTGSAMERNALLYSLGEAAIVVHARYRAGGTWHGAVEAQRRKLARLLVKDEPQNQAHRALAGLGAVPLASPDSLAEALQVPMSQPQLVG